jgi:hypothetical protein
MTEAPVRRRLVRGTIATIIALEDLTLSVRCLPVHTAARMNSGKASSALDMQ